MIAGDHTSVRQAMERAVGPASLSDDVAGHRIDGVSPKVVALPGSIQDLSLIMAEAWKANLAVAPWGGGTRTELGNEISRLDVAVDLCRLNRVVQHNPADLTCTVEAGIAVSSLQRALSGRGQFLAVDPPLPDRATIGGSLASGLSGPLKWQYGSPRDLVIGMKVVQADGKLVKSGGQVVKNVSGYDMARLHIGGLGTLGIIAEVSFKLTPLPAGGATLVAAFETRRRCLDAGLAILHSQVAPLALTSFDREANDLAKIAPLDASHLLATRLGGRPLALERQVNDIAALYREHGATAVETLEESVAGTLWRRLADFGWDESATPAISGRASVMPTRLWELSEAAQQSSASRGLRTAIICHVGYGTALMFWLAEGNSVAAQVASDVLGRARDAAHNAGGRLIIDRCPLEVKPRFDVWDDVGEQLSIMRRMKEQFDPRGILNPGRFVGRI